ncbi:MAG: branched-chain amino acid ABC transporter permease, partial [Chloroflexota bacterium]
MTQQIVNGIFLGSVYALFAVGYTLIFGVLDILNLAHHAVFTASAFVCLTLVLRLGLPLPVALLLAMLVAGCLGLLLDRVAFRPLRGRPDTHLSVLISSIGMGIIFESIVLGLNGIPNQTRLWHILLVLAVAVFCCWRLRGSRTGYALEAIREDETAARALGIDATAYKVWAFVVGAVLAGIAGGLAAHFTFFIGPNEYGFERAVSILLYAIVGGVTTFWGPLAGSALLTVLPEVLRALGVQAGAVRLFVNGAILVAVVLFAPNGLAGLVRRTLPPGPLSDTERGNGKAAGWWSRPLSTL